MATPKRKRTLHCPNCGAEYPEGRLACPDCGSDENTGWKDPEEIAYQSVDIPDSYEDSPSGTPRLKRVLFVALVLLTLFAFLIGFALR